MPFQLSLAPWWSTSKLPPWLLWLSLCLSIPSGWYDPLINNIAYLNFATYAPGYGQLQPDDVLQNITEAVYGSDGCVAQEKACYAAGNSTDSNKICQEARNYCVSYQCYLYKYHHLIRSDRQRLPSCCERLRQLWYTPKFIRIIPSWILHVLFAQGVCHEADWCACHIPGMLIRTLWAIRKDRRRTFLL